MVSLFIRRLQLIGECSEKRPARQLKSYRRPTEWKQNSRATGTPVPISTDVHAMGDVGDGNAEFVLVKRQRWQRRQGQRDRDWDGASAHEDTADPHQRERQLPP